MRTTWPTAGRERVQHQFLLPRLLLNELRLMKELSEGAEVTREESWKSRRDPICGMMLSEDHRTATLGTTTFRFCSETLESRMLRLGQRGVFQMEDDQIGFTELLTKEHSALRRALNVLRTMTDRVERGIPTDRHDVNALLIFFHYFGDVLHQAKEESILFPALKSSDKFAKSNDLKRLLTEHIQERSLIEKAQFALFTDRQDEFIASARKVINLISEHAEEEEHFLFPLAAAILTVTEANEVTGKLQEADSEFGFRHKELLIDMLHHLENKYIHMAA